MTSVLVPPEVARTDQAQSHAAYAPLATAGMTLAVGGLAAALWPVIAHGPLAAWLASLLLPFYARSVLAAAYRRRPDRLAAAAWIRAFRITFVAHGLAWAAGALVIAAPLGVPDRALLAFVVAGVTASALNTAAFDLVAGLIVLVVAVAPWSLRLIAAGDRVQTTIGVMLALFVAYMASNQRQVHRRYRENVALRHAAATRAAALAAFQASFARLWQTGETTPDALQRAVTLEVAVGLRLARACLFRFDDIAGMARLEATTDDTTGVASVSVPLAAIPHYLAALAERGPLEWDDSAPSEAYRDLERTPLAPRGGRARLDVPFGSASHLGGVLCCERAAGPWSQDETAFVLGAAATLQAAAEDGRRREAERRLRELNQNLEALVETRTRALAESELRFRALFDKSPSIVTLVDGSGRMVEINEVAVRELGYSRDEAVGRSTLDLGVWVDPGERAQFIRRLHETGVVTGLEVEFRRKDGQRFWGLLSAARVTVHGEPFTLSTVLDVTERRALEARVRQAQKMEVVGHLAGGVAHDFNNVLTVITSTAELALPSTRDGDPLQDALRTIRDASTRAARLTGQLLAFSRQQILQPALVDLNELVAGVTPMIRRVAGDAIVCETRPADVPVTVMVDRGSLEQVVLNLALNARDAMPDGGTLTATVRRVTLESGADGTGLAPGPYAALSVADTGTGMSEATRQHIFEPFFTTKDVGKGTGLGLAMAHGVVQQSGGDIAVRSAVGAGSTFTIYLPLAAGTPARPESPARTVRGGHETVLVVDDDRDIRQVVRRALAFAGYDVLLADSGEAALQAIENHEGRVHLVLTDVMMPGIGGRELAVRVRARHPEARILFSSGYAENVIAHHGVLAEGVQFIAKPYSLQALTAKVRETLDA